MAICHTCPPGAGRILGGIDRAGRATSQSILAGPRKRLIEGEPQHDEGQLIEHYTRCPREAETRRISGSPERDVTDENRSELRGFSERVSNDAAGVFIH